MTESEGQVPSRAAPPESPRSSEPPGPTAGGRDFIRQIVAQDLEAGRNGGRVVTRFPPEPNGYLHIGHAKSVVLNFGIAGEHPGGRCHLRFDDTNPTTEDLHYVEAIQEDLRWLGFDWGEHLYFASEYFGRMYEFAEELIRKGLAYVDSQSEEESRKSRGTVTEPGSESPYRSRSVSENLELFRKMREGVFSDGAHVLRGKIDMSSPNMLMRDPVLYRIRHAEHYRTGGEWCIYPMYDFAHPLEDALECVTHSLCTLEFENNRELYDWVVESTSVECRPHQYEFARLNLEYMVMSKRKLGRLVREGDVRGWDDPRMPTIAGLRRRGVTPEAIRNFCEMIGVARSDSRVDMAKLEFAIRDDLNLRVPRVLCVAKPLKVVITSWPEGEVDWLEAPYYPRDVPKEGGRELPFSRTLYIEREDFMEEPVAGFHRLVTGGEVRLRYGYIIRCEEAVKDERGEIVELRCSHDPESRGGTAADRRKVKGTIHWVSLEHAIPVELRLYDRLFRVPEPDLRPPEEDEEGESDFRAYLNPDSLVVHHGWIEPAVRDHPPETRYQFERVGYFWPDPQDRLEDGMVFNRTVTLRDGWARKEARRGEDGGAGRRLARKTSPSPPGRRPEVPKEVKLRADSLSRDFGLGEVDAEILAREPETERFYRRAVGSPEGSGYEGAVANWIIHELPPVQGERALGDLPFGPTELARLVELVGTEVVSSRGAKQVLEVLGREGGSPEEIVERLDLAQVRDPGALVALIDEVIEANPEKVEEYRSGRRGLIGFFMGQVMSHSQGKADPELAKRLLLGRLEASGPSDEPGGE